MGSQLDTHTLMLSHANLLVYEFDKHSKNDMWTVDAMRTVWWKRLLGIIDT